MKQMRIVGIMAIIGMILSLTGCMADWNSGKQKDETTTNTVVEATESASLLKENTVEGKLPGDASATHTVADGSAKESSGTAQEKEKTMKLWINGKEIPVIWEDNKPVRELMEEAGKGDIVVNMSMYSNNEQFGPLGRKYSAQDEQMTTANGDIVLYNSSNIVVFYAPNTWSYTKLGKINLSSQEVTELLSHGDVELIITM